MSFLGSLGPIIGELTISDWEKIAIAAPQIIALTVKLEQAVEPVLDAIQQHVVALARAQHPAAPAAHAAYRSLKSAWTAADQRAADFQDGSRG